MSLNATDNSLKALKQELESSLQRVKADFESYLEDPRQTAALDSLADKIHQVRSALEKHQQADAVHLTEEIIALALDLAHSEMEPTVREQRSNVLLGAILQLPQYLEWLQRGSKQPFDLLPLTNYMRAIRGLAPISEKKAPAFLVAKDRRCSEPVLRKLANRLRPSLQKALLGLLRGQVADSLNQIVNIFSQFKKAATHETSYHFWWLAEGLLRELQEGSIPLGRDITFLLRDLDGQVRYLLESGQMFSGDDATEQLSQRLIDHISDSGSGLLRLRNQTDYQPPQAGSSSVSQQSISSLVTAPDVETLLQMCDSLRESLALVKDALDRFARDKLLLTSGLPRELERLHEVANILTMLNMDVAASIIQKHVKIIEKWRDSGDEISDAQISQIAFELILVEDNLEGIGEFVFNQRLGASVNQNLDDSARVVLLKSFQQRQARLAVTREASNLLNEARESLCSAANSGEESYLQNILRSVASVFTVLGCERAAVLLQRLADLVIHLSAPEKAGNNTSLTNSLTEVIVTLGYYLDLLGETKEPEESILNHVQDQVNLLSSVISPSQAEEVKKAAIDTSDLQLGSIGNLSLVQTKRTAQPTHSEVTQKIMEEAQVIELPDEVFSTEEEVETKPVAFGVTLTEAEHPVPAISMATETQVDPEFVEVFFEEVREELTSIREHLTIWRSDLADRDALTSIRRSFHTLKGSGRMVQQFTISEFAWCFESLLNRVLDGELAASSQIVEVVEEAQVALVDLLNAPSDSTRMAPTLASLSRRAEDLMRGKAVIEAEEMAVVIEEPPPMKPTEALQVLEEKLQPLPEPLEAKAEWMVGGIKSTSEVTEERVSESASQVSVPPQSPVTEVDPELAEIFQHEAAEILDASDSLLERWSADQENDELLNELRREMHTLKGSSRMAGFLVIGDLAHAMETVLDAMATHRVSDMKAMVDTLQRVLDHLNDMLTQARSGNEILSADDLITDLKNLVTDKIPREKTRPLPLEQVLTEAEKAGSIAADKPPVEADQELVEAFLYEAAEILNASDVTLQGWRAEPDNIELLNNLRRDMHTLKGGSRMTGFLAIGDLAHAVESILDAIGKDILPVSTTVVDSLQRALDSLNDMIAQVQGGTSIVSATDLISDLKGLLGETPEEQTVVATTVSKPGNKAVEKAVTVASEDTIRVSAALLNNMINEMGESSIFRARIDQGVGALRFNLSELNQTVFRLRQQLRRLEIETEAQILFRHEESSKEHQKDFDPLELDRFSELQQLSRALMETVDDLTNIQSALEEQSQEMSFLLEQQGRVNKEVQQRLMQTRMVRFNSVVPRLRRVVRQAAQELGKQADLVFEGSESEVDRSVLDNMVAPLEHMLRNAISHGIEDPEVRRVAGKPEVGNITLALRREGAELVLNLIDDGAGLNFKAIRAKAETIGMLMPGEAVSEDELTALLLRPGFSTATKVTQISGRGVGLDVLNDAVKGMRGTLLIHSEPGRGTKFTVRLPFSLAVTQALLVKAGGDTYAVPLLSIESVVRLDAGELQAYLAGKAVEHKYGTHIYPLCNLGTLLGVDNFNLDKNNTDKRPPALLFRSAEASAALLVETILGNQEIIVKPVAPQFQSVSGISGATVLVDGRVVVVLDLAALIRNLSAQSRKQKQTSAPSGTRQQSRASRIKAMVIDDSITMRKVTCRFLERHNISATAAKDGVEAIAKLEELVPDLVILDIEMPRMDGFEVATHIRNQSHLKQVPIIMVTSRGGEKHRQRAAKLGVNAYLTKPYQEEEILKAIRDLLGEHTLEALDLAL